MDICQDEWLRYHSFVQNWDEGVCMAKIDNGAGDHLIILFSADGSIIKGFDHESELSPYGVKTVTLTGTREKLRFQKV